MNANQKAGASHQANRTQTSNNQGRARMEAWLPELNRLTGGVFNFQPDQIKAHHENGVCVYRKGGAA